MEEWKQRKTEAAEVTVVCCYNDSGQYETLCASLKQQDIEYELIGIDNRGQKFSSCSSALNSVADQIKTEYVIYSHQDIELPETDMLARFVEYLRGLSAGDILGVAGAVENPDKHAKNMEYVLSNIRHGSELRVAGEEDFTGVRKCDTVDECFFGGRTETFVSAPFDEKLCDNWHLCAVERCLFARTTGHQAYVCDLPLIHRSGGTINHAYNEGFRRLARYYHTADKRCPQAVEKITCIRTVCGSSRTDWFHRTAFYLKRELLIRMHRY